MIGSAFHFGMRPEGELIVRARQVMLSCAFAVVALGTGATAAERFVSAGDGIQLAQTQTKQNRDNRQENRQDTRGNRQDTRGECRDAEGAVGGDKRDCKQDGRQDNRQDNPEEGTSSGG